MMMRADTCFRRLTGPCRNARGFTLLEAIILLVIASIALPGLMIYFVEAMEHSADVQLDTMASGLAQELMEEIKTKRWDENSPIPSESPFTVPPYSVIVSDGETRCDPTIPGCQAFDDIDDYDGLNNTPPQDPFGAVLSSYPGFTRTVTVCYVDPVEPAGAGGNTVADGPCVTGPTNYKLIVVTVRWGADATVTLRSVATNYTVD